MFVERSAIHLETREAGVVARADFRALVERLIGRAGEPHAETLLRELVMAEVVGEAEHAGEKTRADLRGALANLAVKFRRLLDNDDAQRGRVSFQKQSRGCAGKGTTDDGHVAFSHAHPVTNQTQVGKQ